MPEKEIQTQQPRAPELWGLLAEFEDPDVLLSAASEVRNAGYTRWDVHTPFPVHGMDRAMGVKRTILPWIVLLGGLAGCGLALFLQWYTNAFDYPFLISGKPYFSLPAFIPVTFELTVLLAALAAVFGMLILNLLPEYYHPVFKSERFRRVTTDRFFIVIEARDPLFDRKRTTAFLESLDGLAVEPLED
jgi:hypothetical protein